MNRRQSELQVIKTMLKMGTKGEAGIQSQLGLTPEEFEGYRRHLIRKGLVNKNTDDGHIHTLQPTPSGEALVRFLDRLDSLEADVEEIESLPVEQWPPMPLSSQKAATMKLMQNGLLKAYVLEQAEVTRLEALQRYDEGDEELIEELAQHQLKLEWLHDLLNILPHLFDRPHK